MTSKFIIKRNRYVDSVSLMSVTDSVKKADGIENCNASMVTAANREILEGLGFDIPADVGANDLVVAVIASDEAAADAALALPELRLHLRGYPRLRPLSGLRQKRRMAGGRAG